MRTLGHSKRDRTTLPHAKSTISRCTPSVITRQQQLRAIFKEHCYTDRNLSVICTYLHGEAQTPLGRFVVEILYKHVCNKFNEKSNQWSLNLSVKHHRRLSPNVRATVAHCGRHCCYHLTAFTYYEDTQGNAKCRNWDGLGGHPRSSPT